MRKARILKRRRVLRGKVMFMRGIRAIIWFTLTRTQRDSMLDWLP